MEKPRNRSAPLPDTPASPIKNLITLGDRRFVALRRAGRARHPPVYHAVTPNARMALCTAEPGGRSDWVEPPGEAVTCTLCLTRLERLRRSVQAV
jgi:hypothetical protein